MYGGTITNVSAYAGGALVFVGDKSARHHDHVHRDRREPGARVGLATSPRARIGAPGTQRSRSPGRRTTCGCIDLDGSGGNQDRSLSADAVIFPASITIVKDTVPKSTTCSASRLAGTAGEFHALRQRDVGNTQGVQRHHELQNYTVTEGAAAGYTLSFDNPVCTVTSPNGGSQTGNVGTRTVSIGLEEGENVTCTFTNTQAEPASDDHQGRDRDRLQRGRST